MPRRTALGSAGFSPLQCANWRGRWTISARAVGRAVKRRERRAPRLVAGGKDWPCASTQPLRPKAVWVGRRGGARVSRAGLGVAPEPLVEPFSLGDGFSARRRKRQPGRLRSPAKTQPCGQRQFGLDDYRRIRKNWRNRQEAVKITKNMPIHSVTIGNFKEIPGFLDSLLIRWRAADRLAVTSQPDCWCLDFWPPNP
jgi:hypothetical protein